MLRNLRKLPIKLRNYSGMTQKVLDYLWNSVKIGSIKYLFSENNQLGYATKQIKMLIFKIAIKHKNLPVIEKIFESLNNF